MPHSNSSSTHHAVSMRGGRHLLARDAAGAATVVGRISTVVALAAELARVPAVGFEEGAEAGVLAPDGILADGGQAEGGQDGAEGAQAARDVKGVLGAAVAAAAGLLDEWEDVRADEGADLAQRGGQAVVLAADARGTGLGGEDCAGVGWEG